MWGNNASIIEVCELRADDLLRELSPDVGRLWGWGGKPRNINASWIFRGQGNSEDGTIWPLTPSAFRQRTDKAPSPWDAFAASMMIEATISTQVDQRRWEQGAILEFLRLADRYGFMIPDEDPHIRDPRLAGTDTERDSAFNLETPAHNPFPTPWLISTFALAQHYGIPTRLVDWCWQPLVAAYFACEGVARRHRAGHPHPPNEAPFSIFALQTSTRTLLKELDFDPRLVLITAATATNPNLRAQGGLFTLVQPQRDEPPADLDALLRTLEHQVPANSKWRHWFPMLVEFRVPAKDANWLLWQLSLRSITRAFVYPGLQGVVDALREQRYYHYELLDRDRA